MLENVYKRDVLDHCGFINLGFSGLAFTWRGRRRGEWIWERLDRGVANVDWLEKFPTGRIRNLSCFTSDHYPILLTLDAGGEKLRWKRKPFRFEAMWLTDSGCHHTVSRAWESNPTGAPMFRVAKKLKKCKRLLKKWSKDQFGSVLSWIKDTKSALWKAEENAMKGGDYQEVTRLKSELNLLLDREEQMWH